MFWISCSFILRSRKIKVKWRGIYIGQFHAWDNISTYFYDWRKPLFYSSYILVMIAMDRFQAVCYPMNNHFWQPTRSKLKIVIAWILACIMCIPQAILFVETDTDHGTKTCTAQIGNNTSTGGKLSMYISIYYLVRVTITWCTYALCLYFSFGYIDAVSDHTIALISLNLYRPF